MSISTTVIGFVPPDDKWRTMKAIWDSCKQAGIDAPEAVTDFFDDQEPDAAGVEIELPLEEWRNDYAEGYELDVSKIPAHVKTIRFFNSW
jgi:hypothetical protein